ncbi:hypothetical protein L1S32_11845 [Methanogenium sp. S4BF]|uniref:hypothetical protein n=1 Tax=Methanogenium sp. S4BF TaxID=1789226 RepID=UPI00241660C5|nr:hypothetical protein [Methanogenium sp. S4BF]WFN34514.1 hypothetical protein L1S32_11845 [Methanogenium sp. S4BF]
MVHLPITSRVSRYEMPSNLLPMPDGMEFSVSPADFMAYPKETYFPEVTVRTTAATPPGAYVFLHREEREGMYYAKRVC